MPRVRRQILPRELWAHLLDRMQPYLPNEVEDVAIEALEELCIWTSGRRTRAGHDQNTKFECRFALAVKTVRV